MVFHPCHRHGTSRVSLGTMPRRERASSRSRRSKPLRRPELPREFVAAHKRKRIADAIAELTAEQGYEETKIADIVRRAGVARKTLYDNFEGKEEVFLAAFDAGVEEALRRVEESCEGAEGDWQARAEAGLSALLGYVAEEPTLARLCLIEALSATPEATRRYEDALQRFVELTRGNMPPDDRLPGTIAETLVGGVAWIVQQQIRRGGAERIEELRPQLTDFLVTPYLGLDASGQPTR